MDRSGVLQLAGGPARLRSFQLRDADPRGGVGQGIISTCHSEDHPPPSRVPGVVGACPVVIQAVAECAWPPSQKRQALRWRGAAALHQDPGPPALQTVSSWPPGAGIWSLFSTTYRLKRGRQEARAIVVGVFEGYGGTGISPGTERLFFPPFNFYSRIFQLCLNYFF